MNSPRPAHFIFERLVYAIGLLRYLITRRKQGDFPPTEARTWLVAAGLTFLLNGLCFVAVFSNFNPR